MEKVEDASRLQTLQPSSVIIFHPGSRNIRFGRASDTQPQTILHAIGRRRKSSSDISHLHQDSLFPVSAKKLQGKSPPEVESARLQLCHTLQTSPRPNGNSRYATSVDHVAVYNSNSKPENLGPQTKKEWNSFPGQNYVVGDEVLTLDPNGEFNIHFPWKRGQINIHKNFGGSISSVATDLEDIWKWCISEKLQIPLNDLNQYRGVVIIPAMFDRSHAKEMMNLIINKLGFGGGFILHEHVCATFGSGLSCATVVDVGDQKISVSCVEDGISIKQSRIELKYGGADLTLAFWNLMIQSKIPLQLDLNCLWDCDFLTKLKESMCHFDLNRCGPEERGIIWDKPGSSQLRYKLMFGDELSIVPLSFFNPDLLRRSVGKKPVVIHKVQSLVQFNHIVEHKFMNQCIVLKNQFLLIHVHCVL